MKNKVIAALLAFFLGFIGIHKFYLGETGTGIIYLIFFWTLIPRLISFLEGIMLLCTSTRAFDAKYNQIDLNPAPAQHVIETDSRNRYTESVKDKAEAMGALKRLYDDDILTAEEYEEKRRKILASI